MPDAAGGMGAAGVARLPGLDDVEARHHHQLDEQDEPDQRAQRRVPDEAGPQLGEVHVEHHHDEQEQHGDGADVDHDQDHRQELGAEQHEQPRRVEEREDQEEHRVHGVPGQDHHQAGGDRDRREQVEEQRATVMAYPVAMPPDPLSPLAGRGLG